MWNYLSACLLASDCVSMSSACSSLTLAVHDLAALANDVRRVSVRNRELSALHYVSVCQTLQISAAGGRFTQEGLCNMVNCQVTARLSVFRARAQPAS